MAQELGWSASRQSEQTAAFLNLARTYQLPA
jgi:hypothetical protein